MSFTARGALPHQPLGEACDCLVRFASCATAKLLQRATPHVPLDTSCYDLPHISEGSNMIKRQLEARRKRRKRWQGAMIVAGLLVLVTLLALFLYVR